MLTISKKVKEKYNLLFSKTKQEIFSNVLWAILGKLINLVSNFLIGVLIARYLGPSQFGLMNFVISFVAIFSVISNFGFENIEIRELSKPKENKARILGTAFILRISSSIIAFVFICITLFLYETGIITKTLILVYSLTLFSSSFNVIRNYFTSTLKNKYIIKSEIVRMVLATIIKVYLLWFDYPLIYFIIVMTVEPFIVVCGYLISYIKKVDTIKKWHFNKVTASYLLKQSFPLFLTGSAVLLYNKVDQLMISEIIDNESLGYFSVASRFVDIIIILPMIMVQTLTPIMVRIREASIEKYEVKKVQFISIIVWGTILITLMFSLLAHWVIYFTYGVEYLNSVPVLKVIIWKSVGMALASTTGQLIIMEKIHKWAFIRNLIALIVCVGLNLIVIPKYGIIGASWVAVITILFASFLGNLFIPIYRPIMIIQMKSLVFGWKEFYSYKKFFS